MAAADVPSVARAAAEAGWPGKERQFAFFVRHPDGHAVVARLEEEVVGAACGFAHGGARGGAGGRSGWLGLIFVSDERRGLGLGTALTRAVVERLKGAGCRTLLLVATEIGLPLYKRLGFEVETTYHGFEARGLAHAPPGEGLRTASSKDLPAVLALDRRATGEDRSRLLEAFPAAWLQTGREGELRGYHLPVPWGGGPTVARDAEAGLALLEHQRRRPGRHGEVVARRGERGGRSSAPASWR